MSKLNVYGWFFLAMAVVGMGIGGSGCCGGTSSAADSTGDGGSSSSGGSSKLMTCNDLSSISQCSEHTTKSMKLLGEDFYQGMCELTNGVWSDTGCPAENVIGRCDDGAGTLTNYYSDGGSPYSDATAREACEFMDGSFKS